MMKRRREMGEEIPVIRGCWSFRNKEKKKQKRNERKSKRKRK